MSEEHGVSPFWAGTDLSLELRKQQKENADLRAQLAAANKRLEEAEKQEPSYEIWNTNNLGWLVVSKQVYDNTHCANRRITYARPIPPADVAELRAELQKWVERFKGEHALVALAENRIAELERKLAEQQAFISECACSDGLLRNGFNLSESAKDILHGHATELNKLLSEAREEGRKAALASVHCPRYVDGCMSNTSVICGDIDNSEKLINKIKEVGRKEAVPDGWQVVPNEPTEWMLEMGDFRKHQDGDNPEIQCYAALLSAAPSPASLNAKEGVE